MTLKEIYEDCIRVTKGLAWPDKGTAHSYIEVYSRVLEPYRYSAKRVLEIGIMSGESLRMWERYFRDSEVHGVDLTDQPHGGMADLRPMIAEGTHHISLFDASDPDEVERHFKDVKFDVIIEDASHQLTHQLSMYDNFRSHLTDDGIYIIEDVDDIDNVEPLFKDIDKKRNVEILDRRYVKGRFDDVLVIITSKK